MNPHALTIFVATCTYLFLKMFANSAVQIYCRFRYKSFKYREDELFFATKLENQNPQPELLTRADAAWRNDLENIPIFLVAALCGLLSNLPEGGYANLLIGFCGVRTLHTVCLLKGLQPWRLIMFLAGLTITSMLFILSLRMHGW